MTVYHFDGGAEKEVDTRSVTSVFFVKMLMSVITTSINDLGQQDAYSKWTKPVAFTLYQL